MTLHGVEYRRYFVLWVFVSVFVSFFTGCEFGDSSGGEIATRDTSEISAADDAGSQSMDVVLTGAIVDTLGGSASYGLVMDPVSGKEQLVIKLSSASDFTGGVFIARADTSLPRRGNYQVGNAIEEAVAIPDSQFVVVHRKGLDRYLRSTGGTLSLDIVSDTLIAGTIDAVLRGWVVNGGKVQENQEVRVRGKFEAAGGAIGYIVGL